MNAKTNLPDLTAAVERCHAYETQIARIGRDRVAKAAKYGAFLNELFDREFDRGKPRAGEWTRWTEKNGLVPQTLANYRKLADEFHRSPKFGECENLVDAYEIADSLRADRRATALAKAAKEKREAADEAPTSKREEMAQRAEKEAAAAADTAEIQRRVVDDLEAGRTPDRRAHKAEVKAKRREAAAEEAVSSGIQDPRIHHCAVKDLASRLTEKVGAIVTDPPYTREAVDEGAYADLARAAVEILEPGGVLLAVAGHHVLPDVLQQMAAPGLVWRWILTYLHPDATQRVHSAKVSPKWKPIVCYRREGGHPDMYSTDVIHPGGYSRSDKDRHHWGQTEAGLAALIREWVPRGATVLDPFCGAGSTLTAASVLGHPVIGCDRDEGSVALTRTALAAGGGR